MKNLQISSNPEVESRFNNYSEEIRDKILNLSHLIIEVAEEVKEINSLEETLKWGEPSYITKIGSTIRIDWKEKKPDQYAMYFQCTSKLVPAFKAAFKDLFQFEGSRAITFRLDEEIPETELKKCIKAALTYHRVKKEPLLGLTK